MGQRLPPKAPLHDLAEQLTIMQMSLDYLKRSVGTDPESQEAYKDFVTALEKAIVLYKKLRGF